MTLCTGYPQDINRLSTDLSTGIKWHNWVCDRMYNRSITYSVNAYYIGKDRARMANKGHCRGGSGLD